MSDTVYKVVRRDFTQNDLFYSCMQYNRSKVVYSIGRYSEPPEWLIKENFFIFVFKNKKLAESWIKTIDYQSYEFAILECDGFDKVPLPRFYASQSSLFDGVIRYGIAKSEFPVGSFCYKKVLPKKVLDIS